MRVRIVVADQSEARFYDTGSLAAALQLTGTLTDPKAHLHERDLVSDRPGRVFDHAVPPAGRRGAVAHHSTGSERSARAHAAVSFARQVAQALEVATREHHVDRIVLMAPPRFLACCAKRCPVRSRRCSWPKCTRISFISPMRSCASTFPGRRSKS